MTATIKKPEEADALSPGIDRRAQHGYAIYLHWLRWHPTAADAHRGLHCHNEQAWLENLGVAGEAHQLKLLLDRLEGALEEARAILRLQPDFAAANQRFIKAFRGELEYMRGHPRGAVDPISFSLAELKRLLAVVQRLAKEVESGGPLSLFG